MKALINHFLLFCVPVVFYGQAVAQSNSPIRLKRCSYDIVNKDADWYQSQQFLLKPGFFPWGVCVHHHGHLSKRERYWTREAMRIWNERYEDYILRQWGTITVYNIPTGKLFVESCDRSKYNIIYPKKEDLSDDSAIAYYEPNPQWWDFLTFYGVIVMDSSTRWTRPYWVNVMIHELGHALGLGHVPKGRSQMMMPAGLDCEKYKTEKVCNLIDNDFEAFLAPYNPQVAQPSPFNTELDFYNFCDSVKWNNWRCF